MVKTLAVSMALVATQASAGTYQLPSSYEITGYLCGGYKPVQYVVTGNNGTTQTGLAFAVTPCSSGGRGGHSTNYAGCASVTWDEAGDLLSWEIISQEFSTQPILSSWCFNQ